MDMYTSQQEQTCVKGQSQKIMDAGYWHSHIKLGVLQHTLNPPFLPPCNDCRMQMAAIYNWQRKPLQGDVAIDQHH